MLKYNLRSFQYKFFIILLFSTLINHSLFGLSADSLHKKKTHHSSWNRESKLLIAGLGLPNDYPYYQKNISLQSVKNSTITNLTSTYVVHLKTDFAFADHLGFGITFNRNVVNYIENYEGELYNVKIIKSKSVTLKITTVNLRINYHLLYHKTIDPYIGVGAGMRSSRFNSDPHYATFYSEIMPVGFEATAGLRILVASVFGLYAEAGLGRPYVQAGMVINFGAF